jgi:cellulose synthase (UDP-forming)
VQSVDGYLDINKREYSWEQKENKPLVDLIIPVHNVDISILEESLQGCSQLIYPNCEIWIADDDSLAKYSESAQKIAEKFGFRYFKGKGRSFKAGVINQVLKKTKGKYVAIFDSDQIPIADILNKFVAILEQYPEYAFVQAKYEFRDVANFLQIWEAMSAHQLFVSEGGKMKNNSVVFFGTSACFRKEFLYPLPENTLAEDYDHFISLASEGQYGYWLNEVAARGSSTESFEHKISQMYRWTKGQIGAVVQKRNPPLRKSKLKFSQKIDIFMNSTVILVLTTFYFMGILYIIMYFAKIPVYRALGIDKYALIIVPILIFLVYLGLFTIVALYSRKSRDFKFKWRHLFLFMFYGAFMAPFLLIPLFQGITGQNQIVKGEKILWNKKVKLLLISSIFTIIGLIFAVLGILSLLDTLKFISFHFYGENYFFMIFFSIAFMLLLAIPFVQISKKLFRVKKDLLEEDSVFF